MTITSEAAKHHGASLSKRWHVTWVGNNSICKLQLKMQKFIRLWVKESHAGNLSEQVEHVGVSNVTMFADILTLNGTLLKE